MNPVLLHGLRKNKDIVNVDEDSVVQHVPEDIIYQGLKDRVPGKTLHLPSGVLHTVFHSSPSRIQTKWYVLRRSHLEKREAPWRFLREIC